MAIINQDNKTHTLEVSDYNGLCGETIEIETSSKGESRNLPFHFQRKQSNYGYTQGKSLFYERDCNNNLIISTYEINRLQNIKNVFILANAEGVEVSPVFNMANAISKSSEILSREIRYLPPEKVLFRENLPEVNMGLLHRELKFRYGIEARNINPLVEGRSKNGVYVVTQGKSKFVLKYRGENKERAESISLVLGSVGDYFPRIFPRIDKTGNYTIKIGENYFGLEEFIEEKGKQNLTLDYFSLIGSHIGLLHNSFYSSSYGNSGLIERLKRGDFLNEASLLSIYLDLMNSNKNKHGYLTDSLNEILEGDLFSSLFGLPTSLIHRDLNHSNIIWNKNKPKIVDSESIGIYRRIEEFIAPLLLGENMARPNYFKDSFQKIVDNYNVSANEPLLHEEINALPLLLKYSLLKYYVVRSIRRRIEDPDYLEILHKNLREIGGRI